ncbi:hypothetical protein [Mucilaginibacter sp.]|uniref:hypothetical protein n=1 Tax=Mucilaginibacter sp. TaxID=1882438 RepID=UPI0025D6291C|nr:hypothetical protein [Mucilaginibacter sp.]
MQTNQDMPNDPLYDDEEDNLRMENELMRLKLKAELGADSQSSGNLDPLIENEFLKHVMAFEQNYAGAKRTKVFDLLGKPDFKKADELSDHLVDLAFEEVTDLLAQKNIEVDFIAAYDNRTKYSFITEELFDHETDDFNIPGMVTHFTYEEFHPNHKLDIGNRAEEFLSGWLAQKLNERSWCIADPFILKGDRTVSKAELVEKLNQIFNSYNAFTDPEYKIADIGFEFNTETGMGYAEGYIKYNAILESNEKIVIHGPFKLYLSFEHEWWSIFHIVFPGFEN